MKPTEKTKQMGKSDGSIGIPDKYNLNWFFGVLNAEKYKELTEILATGSTFLVRLHNDASAKIQIGWAYIKLQKIAGKPHYKTLIKENWLQPGQEFKDVERLLQDAAQFARWSARKGVKVQLRTDISCEKYREIQRYVDTLSTNAGKANAIRSVNKEEIFNGEAIFGECRSRKEMKKIADKADQDYGSNPQFKSGRSLEMLGDYHAYVGRFGSGLGTLNLKLMSAMEGLTDLTPKHIDLIQHCHAKLEALQRSVQVSLCDFEALMKSHKIQNQAQVFGLDEPDDDESHIHANRLPKNQRKKYDDEDDDL
jgi:hypothetical protein